MAAKKFAAVRTTEQPSDTFDGLTREIYRWLLVHALRESQQGRAADRREWRLHPSAVKLHLAFRRRFGTPPDELSGVAK